MHTHPEAPHPITVLDHDDTAAIVRFISSLDGPELWQRFQRAVTPTQVQDHYAAIDWASTTILGWLASDGICALAEVILHDGPAGLQAEIVLTIRLGWRGRDIGQLLLGAAVATAAQRGAARCVMLLNPGDLSLPIARRHGAEVDPDTGHATLAQ